MGLDTHSQRLGPPTCVQIRCTTNTRTGTGSGVVLHNRPLIVATAWHVLDPNFYTHPERLLPCSTLGAGKGAVPSGVSVVLSSESEGTVELPIDDWVPASSEKSGVFASKELPRCYYDICLLRANAPGGAKGWATVLPDRITQFGLVELNNRGADFYARGYSHGSHRLESTPLARSNHHWNADHDILELLFDGSISEGMSGGPIFARIGADELLLGISVLGGVQHTQCKSTDTRTLLALLEIAKQRGWVDGNAPIARTEQWLDFVTAKSYVANRRLITEAIRMGESIGPKGCGRALSVEAVRSWSEQIERNLAGMLWAERTSPPRSEIALAEFTAQLLQGLRRLESESNDRIHELAGRIPDFWGRLLKPDQE